MTDRQYVSIKEAAKVANMSTKAVQRRVKDGELVAVPDFRDKRRRLIDLTELSRRLGRAPVDAA